MKYSNQFVLAITMLGIASTVSAVTIDDALDSFTTGIGDFSEISGFDSASSPGQVFEVLGGPGQGTAADFAAGRTTAMGLLWQTLDAGGVTSATTIGFGFGINETGATGTNFVDVSAISFNFELPDTSILTYDLNADGPVTVFNYNQGQSTAEAIFFMDLGFDFMTAYSAGSTEAFNVFATLDGTDDGFEILFFGSAFASAPPMPNPEPGTLVVLAAGMIAMTLARRRIARAR